MNKKVLLELCMSPDLGGLELYMVRAAKALVNDFKVISIINTDTKLEQYYNENHKFIKIEKKSNLFMFGAAKKLAKIIDEEGVDIIHMHWTKDIPFVVLAKMLSKRKLNLVQTRNMTMTRFKDDFYHRLLYKNINLMLPVTYQVKEQLEKFIPSEIRPKIEVLYMGSDSVDMIAEEEVFGLKGELGFKENSFNIGMVGRINKAKGQHLLIVALSYMEDETVEAYFVGHEMGEGYIEELKNLAETLGILSRVHFLGFMKNPHHFFQLCDAVVMASRRETFGLVVIEAMQVQTAVIGSNSGGVVEIIDDEKTGLLFEMGSAQSLAQNIQKLHNDPQFLNQLSLAGQKKCEEKFSNEKQFKKLSSILKDLSES